MYAPHDLSDAEMQKWKQRRQPKVDVFDVLQLDPIVEYRVSAYLPVLRRRMLFYLRRNTDWV